MPGPPRSKPLLLAALLGLAALAACSPELDTPAPLEPGEDIELQDWMEQPVLPQLDGELAASLAEEVRASAEAGNRAGVFAKIGDSNSDFPVNLYGLGCREVEWGDYGELAPVRSRFNEIRLDDLETYPGCRPATSFSRDSVAAVVGAWVEWVMTPIAELRRETHVPLATEDRCPGALSPVECELGLLEPRYATILIASNDVYLGLPLGETLREHLEELVGTVRDHSVVPVLSTVAPMTEHIPGAQERVHEANSIISEVAADLEVPLINLWRAMVSPEMVRNGLGSDGVHFNVFGGQNDPEILRNSVVFTEEALRYGANRRNLIWLQALGRIVRAAAGADR